MRAIVQAAVVKKGCLERCGAVNPVTASIVELALPIMGAAVRIAAVMIGSRCNSFPKKASSIGEGAFFALQAVGVKKGGVDLWNIPKNH